MGALTTQMHELTLLQGEHSADQQTAAAARHKSEATMREMLLGDVFASFDLDGDGNVANEELMHLGSARQALNQRDRVWTDSKNRQLVKKLDTDGDGQLSREEFVVGFGKSTPDDLEEFFRLVMEYEAAARWVRVQALDIQSAETQKLIASLQAEVETLNKQAKETATATEAAKHANTTALRQTMLGDVFAAFDVDGDGFVDANELMQLGAARAKLQQGGRVWTEAKNRALVASLDTNRDGEVDRDEFVRGFGEKTPQDTIEFTKLMAEYEAVARWVRAEKAKVFEEQVSTLKAQLEAATQASSLTDVSMSAKAEVAISKSIAEQTPKGQSNDAAVRQMERQIKDLQSQMESAGNTLGNENLKLKRQVEEHEEAASQLAQYMRSALLKDVFAAFDVDGDGFVDAGELMQLGAARQQLKQEGRKWTEAKNRVLVKTLDTNKDGAVSRDEFVRGFDGATPQDMEAFGGLMMEYEAVARWVRAQCYETELLELKRQTEPLQSQLQAMGTALDKQAE